MILAALLLLGSPEYRFTEDVETNSTVHWSLELEINGSDDAVTMVMMSMPFFSFQEIHATVDVSRIARTEEDRVVITEQHHRASFEGVYDEEDYTFEFEYPSDPPTDPLAQAVYGMAAQENRHSISPRGVYEPEFREDEDATGEALALIVRPVVRFPENREVAEGDEWEEMFEGRLRDRDSGGVIRYVQRSAWTATEENIAVIDWQLEGQMDKGQAHRDGIQAANGRDEGTVTGWAEVRFDLTTGRIVSYESDGRARFYYRGPAEGVEGEFELEVILYVSGSEGMEDAPEDQ